MKYLLILILSLLNYGTTYCQYLFVNKIDTSNFPIIKANYLALDSSGSHISNLEKKSFVIREDGLEREIYKIINPKVNEEKLNIAINILKTPGDNTYYCSKDREIEKNLLNMLVDNFCTKFSDVALQIYGFRFKSLSYFTNDKYKLRSLLLNEKDQEGIPDTKEIFYHKNVGNINLLKSKSGKKICVLVMRNAGYREIYPVSQINEFADSCLKNNIQVYCFYINNSAIVDETIVNSLRIISEKTGGKLYLNLIKNNIIEEAFCDFYNRIMKTDDKIEWISDISCKFQEVKLKISIVDNKLSKDSSYIKSYKAIQKLDIKSCILNFHNKEINKTIDTSVLITAKNKAFNNIKIVCKDTNYKIFPEEFSLNENESIKLKISFTPREAKNKVVQIAFENDNCPEFLNIKETYTITREKKSGLNLIFPQNNDILIVGTDTTIRWTSDNLSDTISIEYSNDNGETWITITENAFGGEYLWKKIPMIFDKNMKIRLAKFNKLNNRITPKIQWQYAYPNFNVTRTMALCNINDSIICAEILNNSNWKMVDYSNSGNKLIEKQILRCSNNFISQIISTSDGGRIAIGTSNDNPNIIQPQQLINISYIYVVKYNSKNEVEWEKYLGELGYFSGKIIIETDYGYLLGCSNNNQILILKLNKDGRVISTKMHGGNDLESIYSMLVTDDNGLIVSATTYSSDSIITDNHGMSDCLIIKLDSNYDIEWKKCYGGSRSDYAGNILKANDGGYVFLASSYSIDGDFGRKQNNASVWLVKIDKNGNIQKKIKCGTNLQDYIKIIDTYDNGVIVFVDMYKKNNYDDNNPTIVKFNHNYEYEWTKSYGGSVTEELCDIIETSDKGLFIASITNSRDGDLAGIYDSTSYENIWLFKLSPYGYVEKEYIYDGYFSIESPELKINDIDLKDCIINEFKDSTIKYFIINNSNFECRIDSIYFKNIDYSNFKILNKSLKFKIMPKDTIGIDIRFSPNKLGMHYSNLIVVAQHDTLKCNISGNSIQPFIKIINKNIDFGKVPLGVSDTITVSCIENISKNSLVFNPAILLNDNNNVFEILLPNSNLTLKPTEQLDIKAVFSPKAEEKYNSKIELKYDRYSIPAEISVLGEGYLKKVMINAVCDKFDTLLCNSQISKNLIISSKGSKQNLIIKTITIDGTNENDFYINAKFPIELKPDSLIKLNVIFDPKEVGSKIANIRIVSNASPDSILNLPINAYKYSTDYSISNSTLNYGIINYNQKAKKKITIENKGNFKNNFKFSELSGFLIEPNEFSLDIGEVKEITIEFLGVSSDKSINEIIYLNDSLCKKQQKINIILKVLNSNLIVKVTDVSAKIGDTVNLPIVVEYYNNIEPNSSIYFEGELFFNSSILLPIFIKSNTYNDTISSVKFKVKTESVKIGDTLTLIKFISGLGLSEECDLKIDSVKFNDNPISLYIKNGKFHLLGICKEGGPRLINPLNKLGIKSIVPNPINGDVEIQIELNEHCFTELSIYNLLGEKVKTLMAEEVEKTGLSIIKRNLIDLDNGQYILNLKTNTVNKNEIIQILK